MKRCAIPILLFLIAGAIVNVPVASWSLGAIVRTGTERRMDLAEVEAIWTKHVRNRPTELDRFGADGSWAAQVGARILLVRYDLRSPTDQTVTTEEISFVQAGFPCLGLSGEVYFQQQGSSPAWRTFEEQWICQVPFLDWGRIGVIPLRPIWPGFAINTVFYAAICWLLWMTPFTARRMIRRRRGRCPNCGYDLAHAEHEQCPECGAKT